MHNLVKASRPLPVAGASPTARLTRNAGCPINPVLTSEERTKRSYELRPYPAADFGKRVDRGSSLPALKWMQAIGRPGRGVPERVLVAGCGTGVEAFALRRRLPQAEIVAVDFSPRSIAVARRLSRTAGAARPIAFLVADLTDPDLARKTGGNFDLITCHGVLSYIPEPVRVLENFAACIRPGGALYLGVNGEAHPAPRLRPWLAGFGLTVDELRDERRLRELLGLWDSLNDDGGGELATMSASYLGGDVCGPHFNNWSLARWRAEANRGGWEVAGTDVLPMALQLAMARKNHRALFPAGPGELAARLDQARPAGFHRIVLRRGVAGSLDAAFARKPEQRLRWTGFYSVRFSRSSGRQTGKAVFFCATFRLRFEWSLSRRQAAAVRLLAEAGAAPVGWLKSWRRSESDRRILWIWAGLGVVAADPASLGP